MTAGREVSIALVWFVMHSLTQRSLALAYIDDLGLLSEHSTCALTSTASRFLSARHPPVYNHLIFSLTD